MEEEQVISLMICGFLPKNRISRREFDSQFPTNIQSQFPELLLKLLKLFLLLLPPPYPNNPASISSLPTGGSPLSVFLFDNN